MFKLPVLLVAVALLNQTDLCAQVSVRGYFRKDGSYVHPHHRSWPDGNFSNNWSTKGNINPYTGAAGKKTAPSTGSRSSGDVYVSGYYRSSGTYVEPHYRSQPDGDPWDNWSTEGNVNPHTGEVGTRRPAGAPAYSALPERPSDQPPKSHAYADRPVDKRPLLAPEPALSAPASTAPNSPHSAPGYTPSSALVESILSRPSIRRTERRQPREEHVPRYAVPTWLPGDNKPRAYVKVRRTGEIAGTSGPRYDHWTRPDEPEPKGRESRRQVLASASGLWPRHGQLTPAESRLREYHRSVGGAWLVR